MSTVAVRHKRAFNPDEDTIQGSSAKRFCGSPALVNTGSKHAALERLQIMFPAISAADIKSILRSVNYSVELAAESLQKIQQAEITENTDMTSSSSRSAPKRRFDIMEDPSASSSSDPVGHYADKLVASLQGVPTMDEARSRARQALQAFEHEYLSKQEQMMQAGDSAANNKRLQELQTANMILYRRATESNNKNKELKVKAEESESYQNALTEAQQKIKLLEQQNAHLQWTIQHAQSNHPHNPFGGQGPPSVF